MKHEEKKCNCNKPGCPICDGGLYICSVCGLAEGSLTTDCPGYQCFSEKNKDVYEGRIDFRDGAWVQKTSQHSPVYYFKKEQK